MKKYIVNTAWKYAWESPVILQEGDVVKIDLTKKEENPDWRGWIWCNIGHQQCWVPEQIVTITRSEGCYAFAIVTQWYSSLELNVLPGHELEGDTILNGWLWCRICNTNTFGWVPMECVKEIA